MIHLLQTFAEIVDAKKKPSINFADSNSLVEYTNEIAKLENVIATICQTAKMIEKSYGAIEANFGNFLELYNRMNESTPFAGTKLKKFSEIISNVKTVSPQELTSPDMRSIASSTLERAGSARSWGDIDYDEQKEQEELCNKKATAAAAKKSAPAPATKPAPSKTVAHISYANKAAKDAKNAPTTAHVSAPTPQFATAGNRQVLQFHGRDVNLPKVVDRSKIGAYPCFSVDQNRNIGIFCRIPNTNCMVILYEIDSHTNVISKTVQFNHEKQQVEIQDGVVSVIMYRFAVMDATSGQMSEEFIFGNRCDNMFFTPFRDLKFVPNTTFMFPFKDYKQSNDPRIYLSPRVCFGRYSYFVDSNNDGFRPADLCIIGATMQYIYAAIHMNFSTDGFIQSLQGKKIAPAKQLAQSSKMFLTRFMTELLESRQAAANRTHTPMRTIELATTKNMANLREIKYLNASFYNAEQNGGNAVNEYAYTQDNTEYPVAVPTANLNDFIDDHFEGENGNNVEDAEHAEHEDE